MGQCRSRLKLSENFERHWSILLSGEIHMDQSLVHTFSWGNSYGPMVLKVFLKFPPALVLVHGWLFPREIGTNRGDPLLPIPNWGLRKRGFAKPLVRSPFRIAGRTLKRHQNEPSARQKCWPPPTPRILRVKESLSSLVGYVEDSR